MLFFGAGRCDKTFNILEHKFTQKNVCDWKMKTNACALLESQVNIYKTTKETN